MTNGALKISQDHVWVQTNGEGAQVGISDFAAEALGTIIYVELPEVGDEVTKGRQLRGSGIRQSQCRTPCAHIRPRSQSQRRA